MLLNGEYRDIFHLMPDISIVLIKYPFNACSALISFRIDWFDLLAVQGTLFQHHSSKASIIQCSAFFMVQISHLYTTTGKTIALTIVLCLHPQGCIRRGVRASGPSQGRTGESGAFGMWPHPRGSSRISSCITRGI